MQFTMFGGVPTRIWKWPWGRYRCVTRPEMLAGGNVGLTGQREGCVPGWERHGVWGAVDGNDEGT